MSEREKIFARIREALSVAAPRPGNHHAQSHATHEESAAGRAREWLPPVGDSPEDQLALFQINASDLRAQFYFAKNRDEMIAALQQVRDAEGWKKIGSHAGELTDMAGKALGLPICKADQAYDANELEACDAGITECDALIAQTGSVLITNRSAGGRALSVLPPHHVVLARRDQLLRDLPEAFQFLKKKYGSNYPSMMSFITGPSRTGDIERILVLGAHGPKKLTIIMVRS
jgi:L-lactate dehydrogenase complex protein LldG